MTGYSLDSDPARVAWLAERHWHLGASDVAAVIGLSPWAGPWSVWADKAAGVVQPATMPMRVGIALEPLMLEAFAEQTGLDVTRAQGLEVHGNGIHAVTPDGWIGSGRSWLLEQKVTRAKQWVAVVGREWSWLDDGPPPWHRAQAQMQMAVTGADRVTFGVYFTDLGQFYPRSATEVDAWTVERDDTTIDALVDATAEWWTRWVAPWHAWLAWRDDGADRVEKPESHPPDDSERTAQLLASVWPAPRERVVVDLTPELVETVRAALDARSAATDADTDYRAAANRLRDYLGRQAATDGLCPGADVAAVTWRPTKTGARVLRLNPKGLMR